MKTKKILVASLILSVIMFLNISLLEKGNANLSLNLISLQEAMASGEDGGIWVDAYGKRTLPLAPCPLCTQEMFIPGCNEAQGMNWDSLGTCRKRN